jgi:type IV pilus assembly protein PilY1
MLSRQSRTAALLLALAGTASFLQPAGVRADDTELFVSQRGDVGSAGRANILFLIDTSGSMRTLVSTQVPWDAAQTFAGCYRTDSIYYSTNGSRPACDSSQRFPKTVNRCAASRAQMSRLGYFSGGLLSWNDNARRWGDLNPGNPDRDVECESDRGIDGESAGGPAYAADGDEGPWSADPAQEPNWDSRYTIYDGNWLNWNANPPTVNRSRLEIVQDTVKQLASTLTRVNIGIMRFNRRDGGAVVQAVVPVEQNRAAIRDQVDNLAPEDSTPLSEALYEATRYFMGGPVDFGNVDPVRSVAAARQGNTTNGTDYRSPADDGCSRNFIILLTDGEPTQDDDGPARIKALPDFATVIGTTCDGNGQGECLDDLAAYLVQHDLDPDTDGLQNVVTHTIGFDLDLPLLASTAQRGGGEYHLADDTATLTAALSGIVLSIFDNAGVLASPAVPANAFSQTQSAGDVFVSVFQPDDRAHWPGNLKKYRLRNGLLVGQDNEPVLDETSGLFRPEAFSFWSSERDGERVERGGAASRLPEWTARSLYSDLSDNQDLTDAANRFATANTSRLTAGVLGVDADQRTDLIQWGLGRDLKDRDSDGDTAETRREMGDPLHVQPLQLTYGGTSNRPDSIVFVSTNDGYLHAIDGEDGSERWAFIPARLLSRLYALYRNEPVSAKSYGLDGEMQLHIRNDDGRPGISGSEQALLLFGMGRGGDGVFALDVTRRDSPRLLWQISAATTGYGDLGQTWSRPTVAKIKTGEGDRQVVVFGGGYDSGQDRSGYRTDSRGNAVYFADLLTGERVWSAGSTDGHNLQLEGMTHSIPAALRVVDLNGNGYADRMYVGDTGGRLWRFDIVSGASGDELVEGGVLASLGGAALGAGGPAGSVRRFFETPDVVPVTRGGQLIITVNVGSGHRGHPLETEVADAFFSVRDFRALGVVNRDDYSTPVTAGQLVDVTTDPDPNIPLSAAGWMLTLVQGDGEKVLAESLTIRGNVFFTSFEPGTRATACVTGLGVNRLYQVNIFDGSPLTNLDRLGTDDNLTVNDRFTVLTNPYVGLEPALLVERVDAESPASISVCVGADCRRQAIGTTGRTYWFEDQRR